MRAGVHDDPAADDPVQSVDACTGLAAADRYGDAIRLGLRLFAF